MSSASPHRCLRLFCGRLHTTMFPCNCPCNDFAIQLATQEHSSHIKGIPVEATSFLGYMFLVLILL